MFWPGFIDAVSRSLAHSASGIGTVVLFAGGIHLVERRGKKEQLDPKRQVEISTLLESIPEAAIIVDSSGRMVDANTPAAQLAGRTRQQMRGMTAEETAKLLEAEDSQPREPIYRRALAGQVVRHERRLLRNRQTGTVNELLVSASPILDDDDHALAVLLIARDITELAQLQRRAGDVERHRAIGQMAAALAHDFNNILGTVAQAAALLEINAERPASERKPLLEMIQKTVRNGAEMVQRIRDYLRTGSGVMEPLDICNVAEEAAELTRPLWQKAGVKVTMQLLPVPKVNANAGDLRRVFTNLIINAIDAMPKGGDITISCEPRDDRVVATVSDNGVGIPPEEQKKIFFAYFTTKPRGTGLGLSGAQKILLSYGGNISVHSEVGKGTTFTIVLPAVEGNPGQSEARGSRKPGATAPAGREPAASGWWRLRPPPGCDDEW